MTHAARKAATGAETPTKLIDLRGAKVSLFHGASASEIPAPLKLVRFPVLLSGALF